MNARQRKKQLRAQTAKQLSIKLAELETLNIEIDDIENEIKKAKKILKKKRAERAAQRKEFQAIQREIKKQREAAMRSRYLQAIRTPYQYEGKLSDNASYYAAIKKYKENINRGLIKPMSTLDKYEAADAFMNTLSEREQSDVMRVANEKAEQIMAREREEAATFTQRITERYSF